MKVIASTSPGDRQYSALQPSSARCVDSKLSCNYSTPIATDTFSPEFRSTISRVSVARAVDRRRASLQTMEVLKRNLDAMAAVKLNVLHWHLTEDRGFRVESKSFRLPQRL